MSDKNISPGITTYDPFGSVAISDSYTIKVSTGNKGDCVFLLEFALSTMPPAKPRLGSASTGLTYTLTSPNASTPSGEILTYRTNASAGLPITSVPSGLLSPTVPANAFYEFPFNIFIPAGQFATPAMRTNYPDVYLHLYCYEGGQYKYILNKTLTFSYFTRSSRVVNIAGGGLSTTVDFGTLTPSAQRSVIIQARSNERYKLGFTSANAGVLRLTPAVQGQTWSVPYSATLNGETLALGPDTWWKTVDTETTAAGTPYTLTATIGDTANKRAGKYQDVITVTIAPP